MSDASSSPDDFEASSTSPARRFGASAGGADSEASRYERLREAFVSLASLPLGDAESQRAQDRRHQLAVALIEQAAARANGWTETLCQLAIIVLPAVTGSGVSTYDEVGVSHPFAAADDRSLEMEELQQVAGEGPGHAVRIDGLPVLVEDLTRQTARWPGYVAAVRGQGIGAVWSLPVVIGATALGSLTLYHDTGQPPERSDFSDAATLAGFAAATMIIDTDLQDHGHGYERAPDGVVSLASGVLAVRGGVSVDQALALLRGHAFSTGRRISDIAADVLAGSLDLD